MNAAALEEELKTNTPYWHDNRIHSFGNVGFGGVFASVCAPLDRSSAACLRNHNEELRCIEALGGLALEPTLTFLLHELEGER